ncbi:MAG: alpha/beta hydrolase [Opitutales bacterium]|nr:alpha/beta hydrolase [Opitutales bacterium]
MAFIKKLCPMFCLVFACGILCAETPAEKELKKYQAVQNRADRLYKGLNVKRDVVYKKFRGKDVTMDLILPAKKVFEGGAPVFVNIHGGGWNGGDRYHVGGDWARKMNDMGIAVATISYTFAEEGKTDISNCIIDCKDAMRFLAKNAKKFGINADKIIVSGHSAGGHLSLMTALAPNDMFAGDESLKKYEPHFIGVIARAPAASFMNPEHDYPGTVSYGSYCFARLVGGSQTQIDALKKIKNENAYEYLKRQNPEDPRVKLAELASPVKYLSSDSCPILIFHGDKDNLVSYKTSRYMADLAKKIGARVAYVEVANADHGLGPAPLPKELAEKNPGQKFYDRISVDKDSQGKISDMFILSAIFDSLKSPQK